MGWAGRGAVGEQGPRRHRLSEVPSELGGDWLGPGSVAAGRSSLSQALEGQRGLTGSVEQSQGSLAPGGRCHLPPRDFTPPPPLLPHPSQ